MLVDGRRDQMRPVGRPALVQLLDLKGTVLWSGYVPRNGMDPDFSGIEIQSQPDASQQMETTEDSRQRKRSSEFSISGAKQPRETGFSSSDRPLLLVSAASTAASIVLYGAAAGVAAKHANEETDFDQLETLKNLNHSLIIASGLAGGVGVGLGTVIYFK